MLRPLPACPTPQPVPLGSSMRSPMLMALLHHQESSLAHDVEPEERPTQEAESCLFDQSPPHKSEPFQFISKQYLRQNNSASVERNPLSRRKQVSDEGIAKCDQLPFIAVNT